MTTAIVVGSGPNGLAGALVLARAGLQVTVLEAADTIGGGTRTSELTLPGLLHDHCSAIHPMGVASPFMRDAELTDHGVEWLHPDIALSHPLDGGRAGALHRSLTETVAGLGPDGPRWERIFGHLSRGFDDLAVDVMQPLLHVPAHPVKLTRFGLNAIQSAQMLARRWKTDEAQTLFVGSAAHGYHPLNRPLTAAIGLMLVAVGHRYGWPVPKGGSAMISKAMADQITDAGGRIETGVRVRSLDDLPPADCVLLDLVPAGVVEVAGDRLPPRVRRAYERYRKAPGAFKLDLAVEGGVPWADPHSGRAGTVHLGGTMAEIIASEAAINRGRMPERPFVLVGQQYLADPSRSAGDVHPVWTYAHVPHGYDGDATEQIVDQLERFAPGVRERIVGCASIATTAWSDYNPNFVGGDVISGANDGLQVAFRPRIALDPYSTGIPGTYICSAATPPGGGVHGMCGLHAARSALKHLGIDPP